MGRICATRVPRGPRAHRSCLRRARAAAAGAGGPHGASQPAARMRPPIPSLLHPDCARSSPRLGVLVFQGPPGAVVCCGGALPARSPANHIWMGLRPGAPPCRPAARAKRRPACQGRGQEGRTPPQTARVCASGLHFEYAGRLVLGSASEHQASRVFRARAAHRAPAQRPCVSAATRRTAGRMRRRAVRHLTDSGPTSCPCGGRMCARLSGRLSASPRPCAIVGRVRGL